MRGSRWKSFPSWYNSDDCTIVNVSYNYESKQLKVLTIVNVPYNYEEAAISVFSLWCNSDDCTIVNASYNYGCKPLKVFSLVSLWDVPLLRHSKKERKGTSENKGGITDKTLAPHCWSPYLAKPWSHWSTDLGPEGGSGGGGVCAWALVNKEADTQAINNTLAALCELWSTRKQWDKQQCGQAIQTFSKSRSCQNRM